MCVHARCTGRLREANLWGKGRGARSQDAAGEGHGLHALLPAGFQTSAQRCVKRAFGATVSIAARVMAA